MENMFAFIAAQAAATVKNAKAAANAVPADDSCAFVEEMAEEMIDLWEVYDELILMLGRSILLTLITILAAFICVRIARKLILNPAKKIVSVDESLYNVFFNIVRVVIWLLALLVILDLFGFNTASIVTVLGAAGLTVGLAMKDSLSNVAAGVMLMILRPYKTGDFVTSGSVSGTIKEMGLFSTILETVDGIFVAVPNSSIFGGPVTNYSRNANRRADITVGIAYGDNLPQALKALQSFLEKNELILKDPAPQVLVADLADSSVELTLRFWTSSEKYWDVYWMVKEELKGTIENAGLNIPFPQRVITFVNKEEK